MSDFEVSPDRCRLRKYIAWLQHVTSVEFAHGHLAFLAADLPPDVTATGLSESLWVRR
ncbi:hypothetical protein [Actinomadura chokoriensis]|uniref:Uncharacterized protein n=1 Tax=Actinomadura chokoriensis TaxID=454156 RepID=A0ABV4R9W5_9ACTN